MQINVILQRLHRIMYCEMDWSLNPHMISHVIEQQQNFLNTILYQPRELYVPREHQKDKSNLRLYEHGI